MTDCERTAAYFDGELAASDEASALAHIAECAACQAELGDWMGIEVALSRPRPSPRAAARPRWPWLVGAVAAVAAIAAVIALVVGKPGGPGAPGAPAIALAATRPLEARLSAPAFDRHRPYRVDRGAASPERVPLAALAALEQRGERAALVAALVLTDDLTRARATLDASPPSAARDSDRAAVALAAHDNVRALELADQAIAADPRLAPAHWNRALALVALDLPLVAASELDAVAARAEPGWSDEARTRARALRGPFADRAPDLAAYGAAATALVAGRWAAIDAAAVRRHPGLARRDLFDALAVAASPADVHALGPIADELDRLAGNDRAARALAAVAARNFEVRRRFHARYRALVAGALDEAGTAALIAELDRAGDDVADITVDAILQAAPSAGDLPRLRRRIRPDDAWFTIQLARREGQVQAASGDLFGAERALLAAAPACRDRAWQLACGRVDDDLVALYLRLRRLDEADAHLRAALAELAAAGAPAHVDYALMNAVNLERLRDRDFFASAVLEELRLRAPERCDNVRFVDDGGAVIAFARGDVATAREHLPEARRCGQPPAAALLVVAVGVARVGEPRDRARASALIDAARPSPAADLAAGRLRIDADPIGGAREVRAGLAALATLGAEPGTAGELRAWGYATLIGDAGRRGDWTGALAIFAEELGGDAPAGCLVAVSSDDERATTITRGADGRVQGSYQPARPLGRIDAGTVIPAELAATLAACPAVAVIARPPLHGRPELLPPTLAWSFVGPKPPAVPRTSAAPRRVIVSDARPPATLGLPALAAVTDPTAILVTGAAATPSRIRDELRDATYLEIHAHGIVDLDASDAAFVALSPDPGGAFALTAADVKATRLAGAPIVVLAACRGATMARYQARRWSLPDAFLAAGARAVIAAATTIPDDQGAALFAELRARLDRGERPAAAVAALRASRLAAGEAWAAGLLVFE
jgi:cellulose synthase operon protein C